MLRHSLIKTAWVLFIALFLSVQGLSQAHAAANGNADHTHDGVACEVALVAAEQTIIAPAPDVPPPAIVPTLETDQIIPDSQAYRHFDGRAPPPRGPPLSI